MTITSKDLLLKNAEIIIHTSGIDSLSIRALANYSDCSIGAIYYHFKTKNELMLGLYEKYWKESYESDIANSNYKGSFLDFISFYYEKELSRDQYCIDILSKGLQKISADEVDVYMTIEKKLRAGVLNKFLEILNRDESLCNFSWSDELSKEKLCEFIVESLESLLLFKHSNCQTLVSVLKKLFFR